MPTRRNVPGFAVTVMSENKAGTAYLLIYVVIGLLYLGFSYVFINKRRPVSSGVFRTVETWRWLVFLFAFFWPAFFLMDLIRMRPPTRHHHPRGEPGHGKTPRRTGIGHR